MKILLREMNSLLRLLTNVAFKVYYMSKALALETLQVMELNLDWQAQ